MDSNSVNPNLAIEAISSINLDDERIIEETPESKSKPIVANNSTNSRWNLYYVKPTYTADGALKMPLSALEEGDKKWKDTLVGYFVDKKIRFKTIQNKLFRIWAKYGITDVFWYCGSFLLISFSIEDVCAKVIRDGPWVIFGQFIVLKTWSRRFDYQKENFYPLPIWVRLFGIPKAFWNLKDLSAIASRIGIPLQVSEVRSNANYFEFARACVEKKVGSQFPLSFEVITEKERFEVRVEYSWRPRERLVLDKVAAYLKVPCKYQSRGCTGIYPYYNKENHESHCAFRPYTCPYGGSACTVVGDTPYLVVHLKDDHNIDVHNGSNINHRYVESNPREDEDDDETRMLTVFSCFGQYFCLHFDAFLLERAPVYAAFLRCMADDNEAKNYNYSLEVGGKGRKMMWQGVTRSLRDSHRKVRDSFEGLVIQREVALVFSGVDRKELELQVTGRIWKEQ